MGTRSRSLREGRREGWAKGQGRGNRHRGGRTEGSQESRRQGAASRERSPRNPGPQDALPHLWLCAAPGAQPASGSWGSESRGSGTRSGTWFPTSFKDRTVRDKATLRIRGGAG